MKVQILDEGPNYRDIRTGTLLPFLDALGQPYHGILDGSGGPWDGESEPGSVCIDLGNPFTWKNSAGEPIKRLHRNVCGDN